MPKDVDVNARCELIAEATLVVGCREGVDGTTIRAVAKELGRSTVFITNYLGTRVELLLNALAHVELGWREDLAEMQRRAGEQEFLRELVHWSIQAEERDRTVRHWWLEILSTPSMASELLSAVRNSAQEENDMLAAAAAAAGRDERFADLVFLALRGFYVANIEDPGTWSPARAQVALDTLLDLERSTQPASRRSSS